MCSFAKTSNSKTETKLQNDHEAKPNQTEAKSKQQHDHERAVGYNWPDSQTIVYKVEKDGAYLLCLMINI